LRRFGIKLGIISNWDERLRPLLERLNLSHYFDAILISREIGCIKPGPRIFEHAIESLRLSPHAILHVGDSPAEDLVGAEGAGMCGLLLERDNRRPDSKTISSLTALTHFIRPSV
jgi:putative hydrolase of the HAD superfamily